MPIPDPKSLFFFGQLFLVPTLSALKTGSVFWRIWGVGAAPPRIQTSNKLLLLRCNWKILRTPNWSHWFLTKFKFMYQLINLIHHIWRGVGSRSTLWAPPVIFHALPQTISMLVSLRNKDHVQRRLDLEWFELSHVKPAVRLIILSLSVWLYSYTHRFIVIGLYVAIYFTSLSFFHS